MHLAAYLKSKNLTATAFAEQIGRHKSTVTRILKREMRPDLDTLQRITDVTSGEVTPNDFFNIPERAA